LFQRSLYTERGGFELGIEYLEDWHLWQRYAYGNRFIYVPRTTSMYRVPSDTSQQVSRQALLDAAYLPVKESAQNAIQALAGLKSIDD
jgi:hypothetical protein